MKTTALILAGTLALTGCGSKHEAPSPITTSLKQQAEQVLAQRAARKAGKSTAPAPLTRASLAQIKKPVAQITVAKAGLKVLATQVANNNGYVNFYTKDKQSFVFNGGHLTATRGLQYDLMARDIPAGERSYKFLTPENKIGAFNITCAVTARTPDTVVIVERQYNLTLTEETCRNETRAFKTRIWRDGTGKPWKAEQWIGPQMGFAVVEWLN